MSQQSTGRAGQGRAGRRAGQGRAQGRAGQGAGQGRAQGRAGQGAGQGRAGQGRAGQGRAGHSVGRSLERPRKWSARSRQFRV